MYVLPRPLKCNVLPDVRKHVLQLANERRSQGLMQNLAVGVGGDSPGVFVALSFS